jgi:hypothetical protein
MQSLIHGVSVRFRLRVVAAALPLLGLGAGCSKGSAASHEGAVTAPQAGQADCGHTACGSNFFIDAVPPADCVSGANCAMTLSLVATGEYHINDDYPYKFKADDVPQVAFQGTDPAGPKVFSKQANNWQKSAPQKGAMNVVFQATDKGSKNITGVFKLSVCSDHDCQLEQTTVATAVNVR